jgi:hypothetical protein
MHAGWSPLPFVTFAVISVGGSLLSLLLPETAGRDLNEGSSGSIVPIIGGEEKGIINADIGKKKKNYKSTSFC